VAGRQDEGMNAYPEEKLDALSGKRNSGTPCGGQSEPCNGRLSCLSWVRCESHAQFFGGGMMVTSSRYPTTYVAIMMTLLCTVRIVNGLNGGPMAENLFILVGSGLMLALSVTGLLLQDRIHRSPA